MSRRSFRRVPFFVRQAGLSLIELMIAIAIGVVLMLGMVEVFGTTRAVYQTTSALARIQEGGRFAMDFVRGDLRMAGQWGCFNEYQPLRKVFNHTATGANAEGVPNEITAPWQYRTDLAIEGFEYENTEPGDSVTVTSTPGIADTVNRWSPTLPAEIADEIGDPEAPAVANSDIFVVRYAEADYVPIKGGTSLATGLLAVDPLDAAFIESGQVYVVTDCKQFSLLQASTAPTIIDATWTTSPGLEAVFDASIGDGMLNQPRVEGSTDPGWLEDYFGSSDTGEGSPIHRYRMAVYYVALPTGETAPSLFRRELVLNDAGAMVFSEPQRMVDGVESMQLTYGVSVPMVTADHSELQGKPPVAYATAAELLPGINDNTSSAYRNALRRIKKVRVALLLKGLDSASVDGAAGSYNVGEVMFTAEAGDSNLRNVYEAVVAVRNRY